MRPDRILPQRDRRGGFILAEMLVSLAISGAVLVGLYSLTNVLSRHARLVFGRVEASEADRRGLAAIAGARTATPRSRVP